MSYGWIITEDNVTDDEDHAKYEATNGKEGLRPRKGMVGPRTCPKAIQKRLEAGEGQPFRMLYDAAGPGQRHEDHEDNKPIPYIGRMLYIEDEADDDEEEAMFSPLNNLGTPDAGCVHIQYKNAQGEWDTI